MSPLPNHAQQSLISKLKDLRLSAAAAIFEKMLCEDPQLAQQALPVLDAMIDTEHSQRTTKRVARLIHEARFIRLQTIDTFNFDYNPSTRKLKKRYLKLFHADWIKQGVSTIFVGSAGLGKTHLARALGYHACQRGKTTVFISCAALLNRLVAAESSRDLERLVKRFYTPAVLIIDELAYVSMSHQEANLFFQVISRRHDSCRPTIVTSNKPFTHWNQVFQGDQTAHVIVDRLTECAEIFYLEGTSYRQTHRKGL